LGKVARDLQQAKKANSYKHNLFIAWVPNEGKAVILRVRFRAHSSEKF